MKLTLQSGVYYLDISSKQTDSSAVKINQIIPLFLGTQLSGNTVPNIISQANIAAPAGYQQRTDGGTLWAEYKVWYSNYIRTVNAYATIKQDLRTIAKIDEFRRPKYLSELTPEYLLEFKFWLEHQKQKYKTSRNGITTIDKYITVFKKIISTAAKFGKCKQVDFSGIKKDIRISKMSRIVFHTEDELQQIGSVLSGDLLTAFYLGWQEGLRRGEIVWLYKTDYDAQKHTITIRAKDGWYPKTASSARTLPLRPASEKAIQASIAASPKDSPFIINLSGKRSDSGYLSKEYIAAVKEKLPHIKTFLHKLRHTYGSLLAQKGVNLKIISQLMGHTNIVMTSQYTHFADSSKIAAATYIPDF